MSEHINLKLKERYIDMIKDIGFSLGMKDITHHQGAIPLIIRFSITFTQNELKRIYSVIPPLETRDLEILLLSIKNKKILDYQQEKYKTKEKSIKNMPKRGLSK